MWGRNIEFHKIESEDQNYFFSKSELLYSEYKKSYNALNSFDQVIKV